jgi:hypothetical protein
MTGSIGIIEYQQLYVLLEIVLITPRDAVSDGISPHIIDHFKECFRAEGFLQII